MTKTHRFNLGQEWTPCPVDKSQEIAGILRCAIKPHEKYVKRFRKSYDKFTEDTLAPSAAKKKARKFAKLASKLKSKQIALVEATARQTREQLDRLKHSVLVGYLFKRHFRFGINTITRILENSSSCANCLFILLFPANSLPHELAQAQATTPVSQKKNTEKKTGDLPAASDEAPSVSALNQFNFLTRHIQLMCTDLQVPAGYLDPSVSSSFLSKSFDMNRVSVLALLARSIEDAEELPQYVIDDFSKLSTQHGFTLTHDSSQPNQLLEYYLANKSAICQQVHSAVDSIGLAIRNLVPKLEAKSSFCKEQIALSKTLKLSEVIGQVKKEVETEMPMQLEPAEVPVVTSDQPRRDPEEEVFGADFINFDKSSRRKNLATSFDDQNFILIDT